MRMAKSVAPKSDEKVATWELSPLGTRKDSHIRLSFTIKACYALSLFQSSWRVQG